MLPKEERIASGTQIRAITRKKQFQFSTPLLYIVATTNNLKLSRLAIICKKSLGGAVIRNITRRRVTAAFFDIRHKIARNMDIVIFPKQARREKRDYGKSLKCLSIC